MHIKWHTAIASDFVAINTINHHTLSLARSLTQRTLLFVSFLSCSCFRVHSYNINAIERRTLRDGIIYRVNTSLMRFDIRALLLSLLCPHSHSHRHKYMWIWFDAIAASLLRLHHIMGKGSSKLKASDLHELTKSTQFTEAEIQEWWVYECETVNEHNSSFHLPSQVQRLSQRLSIGPPVSWRI